MFTKVYVLILSRNGCIEQMQAYNNKETARSGLYALEGIYQKESLKDKGVTVELHEVDLTLTF